MITTIPTLTTKKSNDIIRSLKTLKITTNDIAAKLLKTHYHKLAHNYHPDKGGDSKSFNSIKQAYEYLTTPTNLLILKLHYLSTKDPNYTLNNQNNSINKIKVYIIFPNLTGTGEENNPLKEGTYKEIRYNDLRVYLPLLEEDGEETKTVD